MWGISALGYLLLGTVLGAGMHPVAGHFIAENQFHGLKKSKQSDQCLPREHKFVAFFPQKAYQKGLLFQLFVKVVQYRYLLVDQALHPSVIHLQIFP
jgi:hypothetical protein